ncbi:putative inactive dehydrogenase EasA [Mycena sanguinolenta]|uniref:Putative inactive dehydrogenase EasA n=1 Tax=Mycena sanguinolenta TaxID=230812 RepID=A0A8H6XQ07_9AGAR|nr:putative inactive dehydrogenase EasA [Mycena sanguinolenta]
MSTSKLFQPALVGDIELSHRIVYAPTTRLRADASHAPLPLVAEYYQQRASTPGSLLISEATFIAARAGGYKHAPGIWSEAQIAAWKKITDAVHAKGAYMYLQLWALGRAAEVDVLAEEGLQNEYVSASDVPIPGRQAPRALTEEEIQEYIQFYATAASNAVHKAGFDGVEIHAANGFLLDQFLHDRSNLRTDAYGGSVENRARFPLEVAEAVVKAVGQKKTAICTSSIPNQPTPTSSPSSATSIQSSRTYTSSSPALTAWRLWTSKTDIQMTSSAISGGTAPLISAGGYTRETAIAAAEEKGDLIAFSRPYIANPDLPYRLLHGISLAVGNRALYYAPGSVDPKGYTDYPFAAPVQA